MYILHKISIDELTNFKSAKKVSSISKLMFCDVGTRKMAYADKLNFALRVSCKLYHKVSMIKLSNATMVKKKLIGNLSKFDEMCAEYREII